MPYLLLPLCFSTFAWTLVIASMSLTCSSPTFKFVVRLCPLACWLGTLFPWTRINQCLNSECVYYYRTHGPGNVCVCVVTWSEIPYQQVKRVDHPLAHPVHCYSDQTNDTYVIPAASLYHCHRYFITSWHSGFNAGVAATSRFFWSKKTLLAVFYSHCMFVNKTV